jgi:carbonic anhydrase
MKKKLIYGAIGAQVVAVLATLVYLFVGVLSGPVHKQIKAAAESAETAEPDEEAEPEPEPPPPPKKAHKGKEATAKAAAAQAVTAEPAEAPEKAAPEKAAKPAPAAPRQHAAKEPLKEEAKVAPAAEAKAAPKQAAPEEAARAQGPVLLADAVTSLMDGNERFAQGFTRARDLVSMREHPARPTAVVLTCADSTVPPELVFDQPLGSLIVVRTAASLVDEGALAAVEDAIARLEVPVVIVLGHHDCHAVAAAARNAPAGAGEATVATRLKPLLAPLRKVFSGEELLKKAVETNVGFAASQLAKRSKIVRGGKATVMRVVYEESTGKTRWLDAEAKEDEPHAPERSGRSAH